MSFHIQSAALLDGSEAVPAASSEDFGFQSLAMYAKVLTQFVLAHPRVVPVAPVGRYGNSLRRRHSRWVVSAIFLSLDVTWRQGWLFCPASEGSRRPRS